jgi:hypothetical protein
VKGSAEADSIVRLYTSSNCAGSVAATGSAEDFFSPGLAVSVADDSTTTFNATATDVSGNTSDCSSSSITYVFVEPPPPPIQISPPQVIQFRPIKLPTIALVSSASGPKKQDIDKLYVKVLINKAGKATVTGSVNVPGGASRVYKLKSVTKTLKANVKKKIRLKLNRKGLKAAKRALKRGKKLRAKITIKTTDSAGADTSRTKRTIRLKR